MTFLRYLTLCPVWNVPSQRTRIQLKAQRASCSSAASSTRKWNISPLDSDWWVERPVPQPPVLTIPANIDPVSHYIQRLQEDITKFSPSLQRNALYIKSVRFTFWHFWLCEAFSLSYKNKMNSHFLCFCIQVQNQPSAGIPHGSNGAVLLQRKRVCECQSPQGRSFTEEGLGYQVLSPKYLK